MYKKILIFSFFISGIFGLDDRQKLSEALGHLIGKNFEALGLSVDINAFVKGIEDESAGKSSPLSEEKCFEAITFHQQEKLLEQSNKNLQDAINFLNENKNKTGIISLEEGNLQYKTLREGSGQLVQSYNSPLIRCKGQFLNGESFQSDSEEELLSLDEAIPGLSKGIVGMKEGEIRKLYIHPHLGYPNTHYVPANTLLIFEIELIRAEAAAERLTTFGQETIPFLKEPSFFNNP